MLAYLLALVVFLLSVLLAYAAGVLLHLHGTSLIVLVSLIVLAGLIAAVAILVIHFRATKRQAGEGEVSGGDASSEIDVLLNDANRSCAIRGKVLSRSMVCHCFICWAKPVRPRRPWWCAPAWIRS